MSLNQIFILNVILFNQIFMYVYLVPSDIYVHLSCSIRYLCMFILFNQIFMYVYLTIREEIGNYSTEFV